MRLLGAILAGGASRRFGSDKAEALLDSRKLVDHVAAALERACDSLVICGRAHLHILQVEDRPHAGLGPLGGLCAALAYGRAKGFDAVLSAPCDVPDLPADLFEQLSRGGPAAYAADHPVVGLWPCTLADRLDAHLARHGSRSMRAWAAAAEAVPVALTAEIRNINTRDDLAAFRQARRTDRP